MRHKKVKNFFAVLLSMAVFSSIGFAINAHADDRNENDDERELVQPAAQPAATPVVAPEVTKTTKPKTATQTIIDPPTTVVTYQTKSVEYADSDRDGIIDKDDPHPNVPEAYFVKDDNLNGIVDSFENYITL